MLVFSDYSNVDWGAKVPTSFMTSASLATSVISTSVIAGGTMVTNPSSGDTRGLNPDSQSPVPTDDLSEPVFSQFVQVIINKIL